jgi:O-antigen/teichoic acid export membrane protein
VSVAAAERTLARSVALSGLSQLGARLVDLAVSVVVSVMVLRHLGPAGNGDFVLVATVVGFVGIVAELGLPRLAVREIVRDPELEAVVLGTVTVMRVVASLFAAGVVQVVLTAFAASGSIRLAAAVGSIAFVADACLSIVIVFQARVEQQFEALARACGTATKLIAVVAVVAADGGLVALVAVSPVALAVAAVVANVAGRRQLGVHRTFDASRVRPLLRSALPVAPAALIGVLYLKLDAAMVALLAGREDLGHYGAAYQPIEYLLLGSAVVIHLLFPLLARAAENAESFQDRYALGADVLIGAFAAIAAMVVVLARPLVQAAYGSAYEPSSAPLALLACALVFITINAWQGTALLAVGEQSRNLRYVAVAIVSNIAVDLVLIPRFGIVGAAWGTLATAIGLAVASTFGVRRYAGATPDPASSARLVLVAVGAGIGAGAMRSAGADLGLAVCGGFAMWVAGVFFCARPSVDRARRAMRDPEPAVGGLR